jgi:hypothetical protein
MRRRHGSTGDRSPQRVARRPDVDPAAAPSVAVPFFGFVVAMANVMIAAAAARPLMPSAVVLTLFSVSHAAW